LRIGVVGGSGDAAETISHHPGGAPSDSGSLRRHGHSSLACADLAKQRMSAERQIAGGVASTTAWIETTSSGLR